jgi:hypothetical protein
MTKKTEKVAANQTRRFIAVDIPKRERIEKSEVVSTNNRQPMVAASSLSDIVCRFHVAARCFGTTSDPDTLLV